MSAFFNRKRIWLTYGVAMILLGAAAIALEQDNRTKIQADSRAAASLELQQLRLALLALQQESRLGAAARLLSTWGAASPDLVELRLTAPGGSVLGAYQRPIAASETIGVADEIPVTGGPARLQLRYDMDPAAADESHFLWRMVRIYLGIGAILALVLVLALRRRETRRQLHEATFHLDRYFNNALDLFCIGKLDGRLVKVNSGWQQALGYAPTELEGGSILDLVVPAEWDACREVLMRLAHKETIRHFVNHCRHEDGSLRTIEWVIQPEDRLFYAAARDITERERDEREIRLLNRIYVTLSETNQLIDRCPDEISLFDNICRVAVEFGEMQLAWIGKEDLATGKIDPVAAYGAARDVLQGLPISSRAERPEGQGPAGKAFREGEPQFCNDWMASADLGYWHQNHPQWRWGSSAAVPILRGGRTYAVLSFYDKVPHTFSGKTADLLREMARDIELALERFDFAAHKHAADEALRIAAIAFESQDAIMVTDVHGRILRTNRAFTRETGYTAEEVLGKNASLMKSGRHSPAFFKSMWEQIKTSGQWQGEIWDKRKSGEIFPNWLSISSVRDPQGRVSHYVGCFTDISERKDAAAAISRLAYFDSLTELPNRRLLVDRLKQALAARSRAGGYGAVLFLDVDNFKAVNDTKGHEEGDRLLQEVAKRLRTCAGEQDTLARFGGDEYVLLLENLDGPREHAAVLAKNTADKLMLTMVTPFIVGDEEISCSASIGIALWGGESGVPDAYELLKRSDMAMYEAKRAGRNAVRFFDPVMQTTIESRVRLESRLRMAVGLGQFRLFLQRQVDDHGVVLGAEALLRWQDPERGLVAPGEFIGIAEESDLIVGIGSWVLETACHQLTEWSQHAATRNLRLCVNVSARQIHEQNFVLQVADILAKTGADPRHLQLEITESVLLTDVEQSIAKMNELGSMGVSFAMDDFGTGYSSLAYLQRLPLKTLKIDRSFVLDLGSNRRSEAIARTIIQMGRSMELEVLAEGVENERQHAMLAQWGCHKFQGYHFGRPTSIDAFLRELPAAVSVM